MQSNYLHQLASMGEIASIRKMLIEDRVAVDINAYDENGLTPLMCAVTDSRAGLELVRLLLEIGARVDQICRPDDEGNRTVVSLALSSGSAEKVSLLLEYGADIHYSRPNGYNAALDAVHSQIVLQQDSQLLDVLEILVREQVDLNAVSSHRESALRFLSRMGRFDGVRLLLDAGADEQQLEWTQLHRAVALRDTSELVELLAHKPNMEAPDYWSRTALLLAIQCGDVEKARLLLDHGASVDAVGRCGTPALHYAVESGSSSIIHWLLGIGIPVNQRDDFGDTALLIAVGRGQLAVVDLLLECGADVNEPSHDTLPLESATDRSVVERLLRAGADIQHLSSEGRRALLGLPPLPDHPSVDATHADFHRAPTRRFGRDNPEQTNEPFWIAMIRSGLSAYGAAKLLREEAMPEVHPVFCAQRFGQSITFLPDGRIIQIGGEHEDYYDPDFCIYNDVFVHSPEGTIDIFSYPEDDFPPTDFHTATLVDDFVYVVGSLGYQGRRQFGETPVFRLNTRTLRIERIATRGDAPGWIFEHRAEATGENTIRISGGKIAVGGKNGEEHLENDRSFILDLNTFTWSAVLQRQP